MPPKQKTCPDGKIINPKTGRCVNADGKIGKSIISMLVKHKTPVPSRTSSPKPKDSPLTKEKLLNILKTRCNNDADPISMDNFEDMTLEELQNLVAIGIGDKKNCYLLENIYEVYKVAVLAKKHARDPMDPAHELTDKEIHDINAKMLEKDPSHVPPRYNSPKPYPVGYELVIDLSHTYNNYFTVKVMNRNRVKHDLGLIPGWVESQHTGSTDYTSGVLISNIRQLWDKRLLLNDVDLCCSVELKKNYTYWQGNRWKQRFMDMCEAVKTKLEG